jgi:nickel superoxide dismutase
VVLINAVLRFLSPRVTVRAHCDLPCGVYDPEQARIEAESCYKIVEKYAANDDVAYRTRAVAIKEERAELVKHHLDVLWHDYFKPEHLEKYPDLNETFWKATKQASKVKQSLDLGAARELLSMIDTIDDMWKATGGPEKTRVNGRPS